MNETDAMVFVVDDDAPCASHSRTLFVRCIEPHAVRISLVRALPAGFIVGALAI
jgi:hypothetical protein